MFWVLCRGHKCARGRKTEAGNEAAEKGERPDSFLGRSEKLEIFFKALFESQNLLERAKGNNRGRFATASQNIFGYFDVNYTIFLCFGTCGCGRMGNWRGKKHLGIKKWGCFLCSIFCSENRGRGVFPVSLPTFPQDCSSIPSVHDRKRRSGTAD